MQYQADYLGLIEIMNYTDQSNSEEEDEVFYEEYLFYEKKKVSVRKVTNYLIDRYNDYLNNNISVFSIRHIFLSDFDKKRIEAGLFPMLQELRGIRLEYGSEDRSFIRVLPTRNEQSNQAFALHVLALNLDEPTLKKYE